MPAQKRQETPLDYWISFWPTAPLFGVKWRFEKMLPGAPFFRPAEVAAQMAVASVEEAARVVEERAEAVLRASEAAVDAVKAVDREIEAEAIEETAEELAEAVAEVESPAEAASPEAAPPAAESLFAAMQVEARPAVLYDAAPADADDLKQIKGVGPKLEAMLNAMGVYRFAQIAAFSEENLRWVDDNLTTFKGRPFRDDWIAQARALL